MAKQNNKITKFKKSRFNVDMIVFGVIFIYVIIYIIMYFKTSHIVRYEVREGSLATDKTYRAMVIRDENVMYAPSAGYVNYYAREGERVAKNSMVLIMDETGRLNESLEAMNQDENSLSNKELSEFRNDIINFVHEYDAKNFDHTYSFKYALKNTVLKLANTGMLNNLEEIIGSNSISYAYAQESGIISYWVDGFEGITANQVTADMFDDKNYQKHIIFSNSLLAQDDPAYKVTTGEDWSLVIPIDAAQGAKLQEEGYIKVRFLKNQYESWAEVKLLSNADGNSYLQLQFNNSMVTFVNDRFLEIELLLEDEKGLKIPVTSIVQKEFFLIPERFVLSDTSNGIANVMRQSYLEDGTISSETLDIDVYNFDSESGEYYLDSSLLNAGDILYKFDGQETYTVSKRATLIGVYNMNKGYADFKQINILYQNDEYAIVKSNTKYGLNVYDYIVLNAETVKDDQFIK